MPVYQSNSQYYELKKRRLELINLMPELQFDEKILIKEQIEHKLFEVFSKYVDEIKQAGSENINL